MELKTLKFIEPSPKTHFSGLFVDMQWQDGTLCTPISDREIKRIRYIYPDLIVIPWVDPEVQRLTNELAELQKKYNDLEKQLSVPSVAPVVEPAVQKSTGTGKHH